MRHVTIVSGPTCSGKTDMALEIAEREGAEIISCDSVQVYRGMDIGSAKPSRNQLARVKHHLVDVAEPSRKFDVARYVELARSAMEDISARGKGIVVVGGSGFYLRSWFMPVADSVEIPDEIFEFCSRIEETGGGKALAEALLKLDGEASRTIDIHNPRRVRKALERCLASGKTCAELAKDFAELPCPMGDIQRKVVVLNPPDSELFDRISLRAKNMLRSGLVEETRSLIAEGIEQNPSAANAIGYRETINFIKSNSSDLDALAEEIILHTRSLVKKQRKYFRNTLGIL